MRLLLLFSALFLGYACNLHAQCPFLKKMGATTKVERSEYKEAKGNKNNAQKSYKQAQKTREVACKNESEILDTVSTFFTGKSNCEAKKAAETTAKQNLIDAQKTLQEKKDVYDKAKKKEGAWR